MISRDTVPLTVNITSIKLFLSLEERRKKTVMERMTILKFSYSAKH